MKIPVQMEVVAISINFRERKINQLSKKRNEMLINRMYTHKKVVVLGAFNLSRFVLKKNIEFVLHNFVLNAVTFIRCASFVVCQSFRFVFVIITFLQFFLHSRAHRFACLMHSTFFHLILISQAHVLINCTSKCAKQQAKEGRETERKS